jgi:threonine synthase
MLGQPHIFIKDERQEPTGSFKDRQAAVVISVMKEQKITEAVVASTGNVAISYSAYAALAGIKLWAFLPSSAPAEKIDSLSRCDTKVTKVIRVAGTYDQTKQVAADFARQHELPLDVSIRSFAAKESMKTLAFEIAEQLPGVLEYRQMEEGLQQGNPLIAAIQPFSLCAPHWYIQAVSGGLGPVGVWKGFTELYDMGLVDHLPKLACIQASGCAPMVNSFVKGLETAEPVDDPQTLIASVATGHPGLAYTYLRGIIQKHGGTFEAVTDAEAFAALRLMEELEGVSMEPAAGLAFAGLIKMVDRGLIQPHEVVVVNCSGNNSMYSKISPPLQD